MIDQLNFGYVERLEKRSGRHNGQITSGVWLSGPIGLSFVCFLRSFVAL